MKLGLPKDIGLPVIFTCEEKYFKQSKKIHFDIKQENHILWENIDHLKERLKERISLSIK